jgi:SHS2 domain-containing protein
VSGGYRVLEHTADIGIESWGDCIEECFEQAGQALAEILGAQARGGRGQAPPHREIQAHGVVASGGDRGALLVDFLNELLLLHETEEVAFGRIKVTRVTDTDLDADVEVDPIEGETETTGIKAATYHRLDVIEENGTVRARVYLDV